MKIFITGNSGCGKTTLAKKLANIYNLNFCSLDDIVWENGKKREHENRKKLLLTFLQNKNWIIEGMSHSEWMKKVYEEADFIFLLKVSNFVAKNRIIMRYIKKKLGLEKGHKENIKYLKQLFYVRKKYEKDVMPEIYNRLKQYNEKSHIVKNLKDIKKIINNKYL